MSVVWSPTLGPTGLVYYCIQTQKLLICPNYIIESFSTQIHNKLIVIYKKWFPTIL